MKTFLSLLLFMLLCNSSSALMLKDKPRTERIHDAKYEVARDYFDDYSRKLYESFNQRKFSWLDGSTIVKYTLHKDGTVSEFSPMFNIFKPQYNENPPKSYFYGIDVIKSIPQKPFPKGFDDESVKMMVFFCEHNFDRITLDYFPLSSSPASNNLGISIYKSSKIGKRTTPKPIPFMDSFVKW